MFARRRRIPAPMWGALGIVVGLAIVFIIMAPRLVEIAPAPEGESASASPAISLMFSRPMDRASVEARLSFDPPRTGTITWDDQTLIFKPDQPWEHGQTVQVTLAGGSRSIRWLPLLGSRTWTFVIGAPRFLFLYPSDGRADIYIQAVDAAVPEQLTTTEFGVEEFNRSQDGSCLVYSRRRIDGGNDFYLLDLYDLQESLLYSCPLEEICQAPTLSPDNNYLAFDQAQYSISETGTRITGPSRVMLLDLNDGSELQVVSDTTHNASSPSFSPDGMLAYYDNSLLAVVLVDPASDNFNTINYIPNNVGLVGDWSPDGDYLILPDILLLQHTEEEEGGEEPPFFSHLFRIDASNGRTLDLSAFSGYFVEDVSPAYSPEGEWIAFGRKFLQLADWTLGRQIWLMRSDGSNATQLTEESDINHSALAWSADGERLIFMRLDRTNSSNSPEIWMIEINSGEVTQLVVGGYLPQWLD
jgi:Tol biopolymer transport system component